MSSVDDNLKNFQENWIRPLRSNTNSHLPFLKKLDKQTRKELNKKLAAFRDELAAIKKGQSVNDKLNHYARYLIELKLTTINGDYGKSKIITNTMLNDDFLNLKQTIKEVKDFEDSVMKLSDHYEDINMLLQKKLSLEETLFFMDLPHKLYLYNLKKTSKEQKRIVRDLGRHFVSLAKKTSMGKTLQK